MDKEDLARKIRWTEDHALSVFLGLMIFGLFLLIPGSPAEERGPLMGVFLSLLFLSATLVAVGHYLLRGLVWTLAVIAVCSHWTDIAVPHIVVGTVRLSSALLLLLLITGSLVIRTFRHGNISLHRVRGAIAIYLLLGLIWAFAYGLLDLHVEHAFTESHSRLTADTLDLKELVYFSFVTLTTVGYGDIAPQAPVVRSLAVLEALAGQIYLAVTVARLVAMELADRTLGR